MTEHSRCQTQASIHKGPTHCTTRSQDSSQPAGAKKGKSEREEPRAGGTQGLEGQGWSRTTSVSQCQCSQVQEELSARTGVRWALGELSPVQPAHQCAPLLSQGAPQSWLSLQPVPLCPPWGLSSTYLSEVSFRRVWPSEVTKDIRNSGLGMKHSS